MSEWRHHTKPVSDHRHALCLLDEVDSALLWCNGHMPDRERYRAAHEAMWRVAHWIAGQQGPRRMVAGDIGAEPFDQPIDVDRAISMIRNCMGDADRSEFHRGWQAASEMALAILAKMRAAR